MSPWPVLQEWQFIQAGKISLYRTDVKIRDNVCEVKNRIWHTVSIKGTKNMASIILIIIMPSRGWSHFVNISMRRSEFILSKGVVSLFFILLQITILSKLKVGIFWGKQVRHYKSSNFTFPWELRGILLSGILSKLFLKKWPVGKESQWLLMCCQIQHPYLFKGLAHKEIITFCLDWQHLSWISKHQSAVGAQDILWNDTKVFNDLRLRGCYFWSW